MLKFDIKNKLKLDNKSKDKKSPESEADTETNLKHEMIASILKGNPDSEGEEKTITFADLQEEIDEGSSEVKPSQFKIESAVTKLDASPPQIDESKPKMEIQALQKTAPSKKEEVSPATNQITQLIKAIENSKEKMIVPMVDMNQGKFFFPILAEIGEDQTNIEFLEKLTSPSFDILEQINFERFTVCPEHPESLSVSVRLYCPKCNSINISKLHLIEHRRCGYISENVNFEIAPDGTVSKCPSCKKEIRNMRNEISMPAMWYTCKDCKEKFDDVSIRLYCRKFNHDFDTNQAHTIVVPGFRLKNLADNSNSSISPILNQVKSLLKTHGFSAEENRTVTGKSGNVHRINIYGKDNHDRTIFIFIKNPNAESDNSELNSRIIEVLDTDPSVAIMIGFPSISEKAKAITSNYNISLVAEKNPKDILSSIGKILIDRVPRIES